MDKAMHRIIQHYKRQTRKSVMRLPNLWWSILIVLLTIIFIGGSYFLFEIWPWAANVSISAGCGCFTGLVFYFLSNLRNNKIAAVQKEYAMLKETVKVLKQIIGIAEHHRFFARFKWEKRDVMEDGFEILSALDELESARSKIACHIYDTVMSVGYDPLDRDNIQLYRDLINTADDASAMKDAMRNIHKELTLAYDELTPLLEERVNQLIFMGTHLV